MRFEVWAPNADRVLLILRGDAVFMERGERGWWSAEAEASPGDYYGFSFDGVETLPDPRSPYQPLGVNGASRLVDHSAFPWSDADFVAPRLQDAVVYEMHVGTFTPEGTFEAALTKLDHLTDLGVTHVELMPVAEFPGDHGWGYDGVDLFAPHHAYGGPEGLKKLVDGCHKRGLGVLLDVVYNHLGPSGNHLGRFGPYFTRKYATPWGEAVNFDDAESDQVRAFFVDNALMWLRDYHFDGLRLDAVHAILDQSALSILEEITDEVHAAMPEKLVIAESDLNDPRLIADKERGGYGMDAQWSDDFHHATHALLTEETTGYYADFGRLEHLATALRQGFVYAGNFSGFRRRNHGKLPEGIPGHRFLGYAQNHDQVGNRAKGERLSHLVSHEQLKLAAALVLTAPFTPMLFQGEEWGATSPFRYFTDHDDPRLAKAVSNGRKREFEAFGWDPDEVPDPQDPATFEASKLAWPEIQQERHADLLAWHKRLIALRKDTEALRDGRFDLVKVTHDDSSWLVLDRGQVTVAFNFSDAEVTVPLDHTRATELLLASGPEPKVASDEALLPPTSVTIFSA